MINDYTFIDFDGVILDSEKRMLERKYELGFHNHKIKKNLTNILSIPSYIQRSGIILLLKLVKLIIQLR